MIVKMNKILVSFACAIVLNACTTVDDYMLGKDNSPKPSQLAPLEKKEVTVNKRWQERTTSTPEYSENYYHLTPVINDGVIYTANANGSVEARLKDAGKLLWSQNINLNISSGPKVDAACLVVGAQATVVALSKKNGVIIWKNEVSNQLLAPPIVHDNTVFAKTIDGQVFAFNAQNGNRLWRYNHGAPELILRASSAPVLVGNLLLLGFSDGKVDALDPHSGRLVWQRSIAYAEGQSEVERLTDINSTPIVKGNVAYLASYHGYLTALSLKNGEFLWRQKMSSFKDMALNKDSLFVVDDRSNVLAINRHTGMILWHQNALHDRKLNAPAISKQGLVLTDAYGTMYVLSLVTGERLVQVPLEKSLQTDATPIIDDKDVYVLFKNGLLTNYTLTS